MENFTPMSALAGGILIGMSASVLLWFNGRIAGITGILAQLMHPAPGEVRWRLAFIAGLAAGGVAVAVAIPGAIDVHPDRSWGAVVLAGLLVGFGTRIGNGCTSGHGVCGIPRGSARSVVATGVFIGWGVLTVTALNALFGGEV